MQQSIISRRMRLQNKRQGDRQQETGSEQRINIKDECAVWKS